MPEIDPRKRTTKVNLFMIVAVAVFMAVGAAAMVWWISQRGP